MARRLCRVSLGDTYLSSGFCSWMSELLALSGFSRRLVIRLTQVLVESEKSATEVAQNIDSYKGQHA